LFQWINFSGFQYCVQTDKELKSEKLRFIFTNRDIHGVVGHEAEISQKVRNDNTGKYSYFTGGNGFTPK